MMLHHIQPIQRCCLAVLVFALLLFFTSAEVFSANDQNPDHLTAKDIIKHMKDAYAASDTYKDEGIVRSVFIDANGSRTVRKEFKTAFVRPDRFRFEFLEKKTTLWGNDSHYIVYRNGRDIQVSWNIGQEMVSKIKTLGEALAAGTGISSGAARTVPTMLMPKESRFRNAIVYYTPQRIDDESFEGVDCYVISDPDDYRNLTLWVGKKDFLLRKIYREQEFKDFLGQETTVYRPENNGVVSDRMLGFDSPGGN